MSSRVVAARARSKQPLCLLTGGRLPFLGGCREVGPGEVVTQEQVNEQVRTAAAAEKEPVCHVVQERLVPPGDRVAACEAGPLSVVEQEGPAAVEHPREEPDDNSCLKSESGSEGHA